MRRAGGLREALPEDRTRLVPQQTAYARIRVAQAYCVLCQQQGLLNALKVE
jgi:hypothetical protein